MISKPLLKQSIKANGLSWLFVTLATAFMLGIIIIVLGNLQTNEIRDALTDTFVESELEATIKGGAIDGYLEAYTMTKTVYPQASELYDLATKAIEVYNTLLLSEYPSPKSEAVMRIVEAVPEEKKEHVQAFVEELLTEYEKSPVEEDELHTLKGQYIMNVLLEGMGESLLDEEIEAIIAITKEILDVYYAQQGLDDQQLQTIARHFIEDQFYRMLLNSDSDDQEKMLEQLGYDSMVELLDAYDFSEIKVKALASSGVTQYISFVNNEWSHEDAKREATKTMMSEMPEEVGKSLQELGELNINHLVIGSIFYKISGILLPMVYTITTSINLIAGQVDSGSMAYVLSTPTKRKTVTITQMVYLVGSLVLMFLIIGAVGFGATAMTKDSLTISYRELLLLNIGALCTMIAISGICFLASSWFNRTKHAMGIGGGLSMFFLVSTILGLFGSNSIPEAMRIEAMNLFNYTSIITLFDAVKILEGGRFVHGFLILLGIAVVTYTIGIIKFDRKDLPL